ncbi:uncharacterized protein LOC135375606 [Ornithodoros turicata]|uniref:uncharacterized protein LOC135375606 n=1 Tax=Ornithodoros turicata TaxID=34597 RepID=UPI0031396F73
MRRDGKEITTKHIILSFQLHKLPTTIKAGYLNCHVRPYVPNPRRCFKCQHFGHGSQVCRGQETCPKCSGTDHPAESCRYQVRCANCKGDHPVYSRSCPRLKDEKEILRIKAEQNISYKDAKAQAEFRKKGTFSEVVRRGVAPQRRSVETQTAGPPPYTPPQKDGETEVSPSPSVSITSPMPAAASAEVACTASVWDGLLKDPSQVPVVNMELDDEDRASQKSSSSLPGTFSQSKEKRERSSGRGRGNRPTDQQNQPPPRVLPP